MSEQRTCPNCGTVMVRRRDETARQFQERRFCSHACGRQYRTGKTREEYDAAFQGRPHDGAPRIITLPYVSILMDGEPLNYEMRRVK